MQGHKVKTWQRGTLQAEQVGHLGDGNVLVRGARRSIHHQIVQLAPVHVLQELQAAAEMVHPSCAGTQDDTHVGANPNAPKRLVCRSGRNVCRLQCRLQRGHQKQHMGEWLGSRITGTADRWGAATIWVLASTLKRPSQWMAKCRLQVVLQTCGHAESSASSTCLMRPFLRGPRQMTASSGFGSMKPAVRQWTVEGCFRSGPVQMLLCGCWRPAVFPGVC